MEQRLIDANALKNDINAQVAILNAMSVSTRIAEFVKIGEKLQQGMVAEIDKQPTVDAVPVVRCKECRWACLAPQRQTATCMKNRLPFTHDYDWFCADGERRSE